MRILWNPAFPSEVRAVVEPLLDFWIHLLPGWLQTLTVEYKNDEDSTGNVASVDVRPEYRTASLSVYGSWLEERELDREWALVHELCHVQTSPMYALPDRLHSLIPDPGLRKVVEGEWVDAVEAVVCDMAEGWMRFVYADSLEEESE